jgi:hypothetical protein
LYPEDTSANQLCHHYKQGMSLCNQSIIFGIGEMPTDRLGSKSGESRQSKRVRTFSLVNWLKNSC